MRTSNSSTREAEKGGIVEFTGSAKLAKSMRNLISIKRRERMTEEDLHMYVDLLTHITHTVCVREKLCSLESMEQRLLNIDVYPRPSGGGKDRLRMADAQW